MNCSSQASASSSSSPPKQLPGSIEAIRLRLRDVESLEDPREQPERPR